MNERLKTAILSLPESAWRRRIRNQVAAQAGGVQILMHRALQMHVEINDAEGRLYFRLPPDDPLTAYYLQVWKAAVAAESAAPAGEEERLAEAIERAVAEE